MSRVECREMRQLLLRWADQCCGVSFGSITEQDGRHYIGKKDLNDCFAQHCNQVIPSTFAMTVGFL